ncbi:phosphatidylinositol phosphate synthase [Luteimicrobium subarcticum]|uniref:Phosphatidylinositol phosphate synthase n=1 Tax=Luteimicrobium subarcticum TaxID=620910 RepID=A0A2M8W424_9MICO|nr:CDP-alcohol phosphatidyltransferase family protein [Luteimicrobium subarcticum]PJI85660.1 CDP-diacylglycerol inositol 3-phosphatidyltransferase [Luteimicrobium subarcticum]
MISKLRGGFGRLVRPVAQFLLDHGVSPDAITFTGAFGAIVAALWLFPTGHLVAAAIVIGVFTLSDALDGTMARLADRVSVWGAFLDSTLDRVVDGAIFVGLALWFVQHGDPSLEPWGLISALACLAIGGVVPYARAKGESLGFDANVGIAERGERLVISLTVAGLVGLGVPEIVLVVVLYLLALASAVTVVQRMAAVHRQAKAASGEVDAA